MVAYVVNMRDRLEQTTALAQEHMRSAQANQKSWYDKKARDRIFFPGQRMLLLLPSSDSNLLARWQGPYEVTKRLIKVTYELYMPDKLKKQQCFHVNLLKEFQELAQRVQWPVQQHLMICPVTEEEGREQSFPTAVAEPAAVNVDHLQPVQQGDKALLDPELFQEKPGFTTLVRHKVHLKIDAIPCRKCYRIPERLVYKLKKETDLMLQLGIIETSTSE